MKKIHQQILRMLPGPFFGWLATLIFLLVMQFLIRYLPDLVGRGLPVLVIFEIVVYNLAYMVVLAVPMSVLISTLMAFGKLAEANVYTVLKSTGVSLVQIIWPVLILSMFVTAGMWKFNSQVLPAANFKASSLWKDIRKKKPGFELVPGVFYNGIKNYSILVQELPPESNELIDVVIFDYSEDNRQQVTIKAQKGELVPVAHNNSVEMVLEDGEIHRVIPARSRNEEVRYERLQFSKHKMSLDLSELSFERSDPNNGYRSDRTMATDVMVAHVDSLKLSILDRKANILNTGMRFLADSTYLPPRDTTNTQPDLIAPSDTAVAFPSRRLALAGLNKENQVKVYENALGVLRNSRKNIDKSRRNISYEDEQIRKFKVEIYKKYSIAVACIIFSLIGVPLGLSMKRGGLGAVGATALGIFMFYWITLVQGEKMADRQFIEPWIGMWGANIVMSVIAAGLILFVVLDLRARVFYKRPTSPEKENTADYTTENQVAKPVEKPENPE